MHDSRQTAEFVKLLTGYQRHLYLYIVTLLPNTTDAEEVLQETNTTIWSKADEFVLGTNFAAWAKKIAYYEVLAFRKHAARDRLRFSNELIDTMAAEQHVDEEWLTQRRLALGVCMKKLNPDDRELITQRYVANITVRELAEQLGRPLKSIYRSLERIRMALLKCINRVIAGEEHR